ncbi:hypothetical protein [Kiloniella sp.]|uniref:hypothetical protein n=1 Tax=Kiloniella sp. TaxID=1938587 RepID=UPI003B02D563
MSFLETMQWIIFWTEIGGALSILWLAGAILYWLGGWGWKPKPNSSSFRHYQNMAAVILAWPVFLIASQIYEYYEGRKTS